MSNQIPHDSSLSFNQNENPIGYDGNPLKDLNNSLGYSFTNQFRVFGKELTNLPSNDPQLNKNHIFKPNSQKNESSRFHTQKLRPINTDMSINSSKADFSLLSDIEVLSARGNVSKRESFPFFKTLEGNMTLREAIEEVGSKYVEKIYEEDIVEQELEVCDIQEQGNPQYVSEYASTIFKYLRENDDKFVAKNGYLSKQTDINEKMRAILIDWLIDVHLKFKLLPETLFLTINIIDRYLECAVVTRQRLQLVGVTSMLIASKYEEIYAPEINDFVYVTDKAYTREEVLDMEGKILAGLKFNLTTTTANRFLERYAKVHGVDERTNNLAKYLIELALIEYKMLKYSQSNIACSALYLACKILKKEAWNDVLTRNTQYSESQIRPGAKDLCVLLQNASRTSLQAVKKKFSSAKFMEISKIQLDKH